MTLLAYDGTATDNPIAAFASANETTTRTTHTTPGANVASAKGLRPFSGRSTMRLFSMVWLRVELVVSRVPAAPWD